VKKFFREVVLPADPDDGEALFEEKGIAEFCAVE
jgi:hypothetical protein